MEWTDWSAPVNPGWGEKDLVFIEYLFFYSRSHHREADGKSPWFPGQLLHSEARQEGTHKTTKEVLGGVRIQMALRLNLVPVPFG